MRSRIIYHFSKSTEVKFRKYYFPNLQVVYPKYFSVIPITFLLNPRLAAPFEASIFSSEGSAAISRPPNSMIFSNFLIIIFTNTSIQILFFANQISDPYVYDSFRYVSIQTLKAPFFLQVFQEKAISIKTISDLLILIGTIKCL